MLAAGTAIAMIADIATGNRFRTIHTGFGDGMVFYRSRIATIIRQEAVETRDHDNAIATVIISVVVIPIIATRIHRRMRYTLIETCRRTTITIRIRMGSIGTTRLP